MSTPPYDAHALSGAYAVDALDDDERALLAQHASCMAWAPTCSWYANCER